MTTYFMGAYTFSAHPPFRLLSVSARPLTDDAFYTGEWFYNHKRSLDYVLFPMNTFLRDNYTAVLIFGHQVCTILVLVQYVQLFDHV